MTKSNDSVFGKSQRQNGEGHVNTERKLELYRTNAKKMSKIVSSYQNVGERHGADAVSEPPEGRNSANTLILYI